jgi:hypothetical protein
MSYLRLVWSLSQWPLPSMFLPLHLRYQDYQRLQSLSHFPMSFLLSLLAMSLQLCRSLHQQSFPHLSRMLTLPQLQ